jgi:dUTP pyrophosphatase
MKIELKILHENCYPDYATPGSAGVDLKAASLGNSNVGLIEIFPGCQELIGTGVSIHIKDPGYAGMIIPRSSMGKKGIVLGNLVGLIDSDYQGEIKVLLWNRGNDIVEIEYMDRIAQLVLVPVVQAQFEIVQEFEQSQRGAGGFGSTGK